MQVRVPNAMTVNTIGCPGGSIPFPLLLQIEPTATGTTGCDVYPVELREAMDLLVPRMLPCTLLTDVDTLELIGTDVEPLAETVERYGLEVLAEDSGTVIVPTSGLLALFGALRTYNLTMVDLPAVPDDLATTWLTVVDGAWPALPRLPDSTLYASSHDDVYLWVESVDPDLPRRLGQQLLATAVGTHLLAPTNTDGDAVDVTPPPLEMVDAVLGDEQVFSAGGDAIRVTADAVTIPFVRRFRRPFDEVPPTHDLTYERSTAAWTIDALA